MTDATEVMLLRWAENSKGRTVTFLLPDDPGDHPFKGEKCGPQQGQRYGMALARIADDETVGGDKPPPRDWFTMAPSQRAGILCNDPAFQRFLDHTKGYYISGPLAAGGNDKAWDDWAANNMRTHCRVSSRKAFDTEERARLRFEELETEYLRSVGRIAEAR